MAQYNVGEAKAKFSELLNKALAGEVVIIARDNRPVVRLEPIGVRGRKRKPGTAKGKIRIADDFDETPAGFEEYLA
jgi:prevent-host-death family protein